MKKAIKLLTAMAFVCIAFAASAQSNNDNALAGKARGAAHECIQNANLSNLYRIDVSVELSGICFVEGFTHRAYVSASIPGSEAPTLLIATVDFDCGGNVFGVTCNY